MALILEWPDLLTYCCFKILFSLRYLALLNDRGRPLHLSRILINNLTVNKIDMKKSPKKNYRSESTLKCRFVHSYIKLIYAVQVE